MSRKEDCEAKAWALLCEVTGALGLRSVDAEYVKEAGEYYLRCYIDKDGGVGIDDCEAVSRALDPLLDREDFIPDPYTLEVSSPGLGRALRRPRDFDFALGREVELSLYRALDGKKEWRGVLTSFDAKTVTISADGAERVFEKQQISKIHLAFDF